MIDEVLDGDEFCAFESESTGPSVDRPLSWCPLPLFSLPLLVSSCSTFETKQNLFSVQKQNSKNSSDQRQMKKSHLFHHLWFRLHSSEVS